MVDPGNPSECLADVTPQLGYALPRPGAGLRDMRKEAPDRRWEKRGARWMVEHQPELDAGLINMRGRMYDRKSYVPPFQIGQPLEGGCVGQVIESKNEGFKAGDYVLSMLGWREYFVSGGDGLTKIDPSLAPVQAYLGALGILYEMSGTELCRAIKGDPGDVVFASISSGTLEMSNVDLAEEFVDMIVAQRGLQANARVLTASDEMLSEVVNLTR